MVVLIQVREISLAHNGVFLDELPEFKRSVLEVLRQPTKTVLLQFPGGRKSYLAESFYVVASMGGSPK